MRGYDPAGTGLTCFNSTATYTGNRINTATYDASGDTTNDGTYNYVYDPDSHLSTIAGGGYSVGYLYDPEGNRVASNVNGVITTFGRDPGGAIAWRNYNSAQPQEIYLNGRHFGSLAMNPDHTPAHIYYSMLDQVGTEREQFDQNKNSVAKFTSLPFGEALTTAQGANPDSVHFTGKERDTESGNDYFGARYYASNMSRFLSPDPGGVAFSNPANPQSWNLYSYVQNNPLTNTDPDGHDCVTNNGDGTVSTNVGDCGNENDDAANREFYINCDGCTANSTGATLDSTTGDLYLTDANGNGIAGTNVIGFADPAGPSAQTGASTATSGTNTTIDLFGTNWQTTQFRHGTHPYRDNNPGDIISGRFVNGRGAIGADGRFGVFPSTGQGKAALDALLHGPAYNSLTVSAAIERYAPGFENNTAGYQQFIQNVVGVSGNAPLSSLSPSQFSALENGISRYEGFSAAGNYSITTTVNY